MKRSTFIASILAIPAALVGFFKPKEQEIQVIHNERIIGFLKISRLTIKQKGLLNDYFDKKFGGLEIKARWEDEFGSPIDITKYNGRCRYVVRSGKV